MSTLTLTLPPSLQLSESDTLAAARAKMQESLENGLRLGWLINPKTQTVEIHLWEF